MKVMSSFDMMKYFMPLVEQAHVFGKLVSTVALFSHTILPVNAVNPRRLSDNGKISTELATVGVFAVAVVAGFAHAAMRSGIARTSDERRIMNFSARAAHRVAGRSASRSK